MYGAEASRNGALSRRRRVPTIKSFQRRAGSSNPCNLFRHRKHRQVSDIKLRNNYAYSFRQFASIYLAHIPNAIYPTANADINTATNGESSSNYSMVVLAPGLDPRRPSLHRRPFAFRRPNAGLCIISARAPLHECKSKVFWQV